MIDNRSIENLEIHLVHHGCNGLIASYSQVIKSPLSVLSEDIIDEEGNPMFPIGGIRMFHKGLWCFLDVSGADDISDYLLFLMNSLDTLLLDSLSSPEAISHVSEKSNGIIALKANQDKGKLHLSYLSVSGTAILNRDYKYFENLVINTREWILASIQALNEYKLVAERDFVTLMNNPGISKDQFPHFHNHIAAINELNEKYAHFSSQPHS